MALAAGSLRFRARRATRVHAGSSRSHLIITATVTAAPAGGSPGKWPCTPGQGHRGEMAHGLGVEVANTPSGDPDPGLRREGTGAVGEQMARLR